MTVDWNGVVTFSGTAETWRYERTATNGVLSETVNPEDLGLATDREGAFDRKVTTTKVLVKPVPFGVAPGPGRHTAGGRRREMRRDWKRPADGSPRE